MAFEASALNIALPPLEERPRGLLTQVATRVSLSDDRANRVAFGAKIQVSGPLEVEIEAIDCEDMEPVEGRVSLDWLYTQAFTMREIFECSTLGNDPETHARLVRQAVEMTLSEGLATALTQTTVPGVLNLAEEAEFYGSWATIDEVLAVLDLALAEKISNARGVILMNPAHLTEAVDAGGVIVFPERLETPSGHRVVADAGVPTSDIFATGAIGFDYTSPTIFGGDLGQTIPAKNITEWLAQTYGVVVFNPDHSARVEYEADLSS